MTTKLILGLLTFALGFLATAVVATPANHSSLDPSCPEWCCYCLQNEGGTTCKNSNLQKCVTCCARLAACNPYMSACQALCFDDWTCAPAPAGCGCTFM